MTNSNASFRTRALTLLFALLVVAGLPSGADAQWQLSGNDIYNTNSGNVGIGTTSPTTRFDLQGDHYTAQVRLFSDHYGQGINGAHTAILNLWAGEPGWTFTGAGLGNNIVNYSGAGTYKRVTTTRGGSYVRLLENSIGLNVVDSSGTDRLGISISGSGNVGIGTDNPTAKLHVAGDITASGALHAVYQDVAEWVKSSEPLPAGTVLTIGDQSRNTVERSSRAYDTAVAGVVSAQPGIVLGEKGSGRLLAAQSGRVLVKVDARNGAIESGDLLVTSATQGHAMKSSPVTLDGITLHRPGTILGKALEPLATGTGEILVLLTLQ